MATTSSPVITPALWLETQDQFLNEIAEAVATNNIPDRWIINVDQTPFKVYPNRECNDGRNQFTTLDKERGNNKQGLALTIAETLDGTALPFQLIYQGKTARSLPSANFPGEFCLSYNEKHWSNEKGTLEFRNMEVKHPQAADLYQQMPEKHHHHQMASHHFQRRPLGQDWSKPHWNGDQKKEMGMDLPHTQKVHLKRHQASPWLEFTRTAKTRRLKQTWRRSTDAEVKAIGTTWAQLK